ncbi:hypothetical protein NK553_17375 [Pseudomonas sp. ZM23]|uniref:Uncharacterized protein n=1 Tax=Pseudomonas triclosanedens TaxID=2961893 RepID=A0ABY7A4A0_9PSED|nr:hypothetical protein [Pseudomonas triclosanedens]MCP8465722.1 hypothetical protein [Pseudomonas triclosanedens]MCP8471217.1 hypothetical protein [Pseudomonas triclosanedens]MCP8477021.1 hypothetical protein [Pseudomonas triclosanedens]WAI51869.1 hypothetical protein OU419_11665 [Pseudomonas triclosanedens]
MNADETGVLPARAGTALRVGAVSLPCVVAEPDEGAAITGVPRLVWQVPITNVVRHQL